MLIDKNFMINTTFNTIYTSISYLLDIDNIQTTLLENLKESIGPLKPGEEMNEKRWGNHLTLSLLMHYFKDLDHPKFKGIVIWQHSILGNDPKKSKTNMIEYINVNDEEEGVIVNKTIDELSPNWDEWAHLAFTNDQHYQIVKLIKPTHGESEKD